MCGGGGNASNQAEEMERQRQATIAKNVEDINSAFSGREGQYADFIGARRKQYGDELGRQQKTAARNTKFALARGGLTGGSASVDAGKRLAEELNLGTLAAENKASGELAALKSADENSRNQMIALAQSGASIGSGASQTAASLRANIDSARTANVAEGLGNVFGGAADAYKTMQEQSAIRKGLRYSSLYAQPNQGTSIGGGYS